MNKSVLKEQLCNHQYTNNEKAEANEIVKIIKNEGFNGFPHLDAGCPIYANGTNPDGSVRYFASGDCGFVNVIAVAHKDGSYGFDYYIVEVGDRGCFRLIDFQDHLLPKFEARCQKEWGCNAIPYDCLLYYLMTVKLDDNQRDNIETVSYVLHEGYCLRATIDESTEKYKLEPVHRYGSGMALDEVIQYGCHFSKPVFKCVECPVCHHSWMFDNSNISEGEKYELICKRCETMLIRKKV